MIILISIFAIVFGAAVAILDGQKKIKEGLAMVEVEMSRLHDRMCQLGDMQAKYKKLL